MHRFGVVFLVALVLASAASTALYFAFRGGSSAGTTKATSLSEIPIATKDLEVGTLVSESDVKLVKWPQNAPAEAVLSVSDAIGRGVVATVYKGEPLLGYRLAARGAGAGLAASIPPGKRAVALKVNEVIGLAGYVLPGMHVDVIASGSQLLGPGSTGEVVSRTVLQNIEVISAGQKLERSTDGKPIEVQVVNLVVTPSQAEVLSLVSSEAKVQLVLRNPLDREEQKTQGVLLHDVLNSGNPAPVAGRKPVPQTLAAVTRIAPPKPQLRSIEVFTGVKKTESFFQ